jgi:fatty acid amide hydrolase
MSRGDQFMEIIQMGLETLAHHLRTGELSSVEITTAFLDRIHEVQKTVRPMARVFPQKALKGAQESDARRQRGTLLSAYDGVPLTLKESIDFADTETTLGLPSRREMRAARHAVASQLLCDAGIVTLGKTNVSQALLFNESRNPLFGQTQNPFNARRSPGGSSGGEAAAVAAYASPGGFGTDIGGSIRVPAHNCGVCGLKPTVDRISNRGVVSSVPGQEVVRGQIGPIARHVRDLRALLKIVSPEACARLDPRVVGRPIHHGEPKEIKKLKIGFYDFDGVIEASAANQRAVLQAVRTLKDAGATVQQFEPPMAEEILFTYIAALSADGAKTLSAQLPIDDADMALTLLLKMVRMPRKARKAAGVGLTALGERVAGRMLESIGEKSVEDLWALTSRARQIRMEIFDHWNHFDFDLVICPPHATPALPHGSSRDFTIGGSYAFRYNFLDFPAGVVPVTTVRAEETGRYNQRQKHDRIAAEVDAQSQGLPVGVQVVARPNREGLILDAMEFLEDAFKSNDDYPRISHSK